MVAFHRHYAYILRALGLVAAAVVAARILLTRGPGASPVETGLRVSEVVVALAVGILATPRRPRAVLNALALTLLLTIAAVNAARLAFQSTSPWEAGAVLIAVLLSAVFLLTWSWRWQLLLVAFTVGPTSAALLWPGDVVFRETGNFFITLLGVGAGSVVGVYLVQRFREGLAASEARYRALFAGAREAIVIMNPDGTVSECNPAFGALVGYPAERVVGRPGTDFLSPLQPDGTSGPDWFERHFRAALAGEHGTATAYLSRADGGELEAEMTYARLQTPQGLVVQVVLRDLTEHRALERRRQRERRVEALARLAGGISHQFNNLLAGVLTDATALRAEVQREDQAEALDEIAEAARRGRELARELIRFAQYEAVVLRLVAPAAVLERVTTLAQGTVVSGVTLVADVPPGLPDVAADVDELVHACLQLVVNAQDAMPEGGPITLSAFSVAVNHQDPSWPGAAVGEYVSFTVRDTGKGMDAATRERVFEPFSGGRPVYEGTGVGLPAVYGIVRAHKGTVRIDSSPGHGTAIHLLIPVWKEEPLPALRRPTPVPGQPRATVLVVDDEAIVRHSVNRALSRFGYRVLEAENADGAVAQFAAADPPVDLVLLDIVFPGGARTVFRDIREQTRSVPILLSSGYASHGDETIQALLAAGACGFLRKPYEVEELRQTVAHALGEADD
ncbi:MAG: response regulator [Gemmatimonadetes bacterium]|nr:response regulator [Gemmatimonadota bacterium]